MYKFQNGLLTSGVCLIFPSLRKIHSYKFKNCTESPLIFYPSYFFYWQLKLRQNSKIWFINSVVGHNIQCIQSKRNSAEANFNIPSVHSSPPPLLLSPTPWISLPSFSLSSWPTLTCTSPPFGSFTDLDSSSCLPSGSSWSSNDSRHMKSGGTSCIWTLGAPVTHLMFSITVCFMCSKY